MTVTATDPSKDDAPFHSVVFGEGTAAEQRFSFTEFQEIPLRQRVRLLMGMPARFFSRTGIEIPRAQAMRFRDASDESGPIEPGAGDKPNGNVEPLARLLVDSTECAELRKGIEAAQIIVAHDRKQRSALATGLLRAAQLLDEQGDDRGTVCAALRRFGELAATTEVAGLYHFVRPRTHAETMQAAMQAIWTALSANENFGLGVLAVRTRQLINKYLDIDWLCLPSTQALAADCLLAYSVLAPNEEEPALRAVFKRAKALAPTLPFTYVADRIKHAHGVALANRRSIRIRLELLTVLIEEESSDGRAP
jgi:hypothetical protein